jgi:hypothetical protein
MRSLLSPFRHHFELKSSVAVVEVMFESPLFFDALILSLFFGHLVLICGVKINVRL